MAKTKTRKQRKIVVNVFDIFGEHVYSGLQGQKLFDIYNGSRAADKIIFNFEKVKFSSAMFWNHFLANINKQDFDSGKISIAFLNETGKLLFSECFYS